MHVNGRAYPWAYSACGDTHIAQYAPRHVRLIDVSGVQEGADVGAIWNCEERLRFEDAIHAHPRGFHSRLGVEPTAELPMSGLSSRRVIV